jgi:tetratricopeptide (TPR) repeat protein
MKSKALPFYQRALAIQEQVPNVDPTQLAVILSNLASLYQDQGKYAFALPLYQRAVEISERAVGSNHHTVARWLNNLADLHLDQGNYATALLFFQRALAIYESTQGPNSLMVARVLGNLARLYHKQGNHTETVRVYRRLLPVLQANYDPRGVYVEQALCGLAEAYGSLGMFGRAARTFQRPLGMGFLGRFSWLFLIGCMCMFVFEYVWGSPSQEGSFLVLAAICALVTLAYTRPSLDIVFVSSLSYLKYKIVAIFIRISLPLYQLARQALELVLGHNHPSLVASLDGLAFLYFECGKEEEALNQFERAVVRAQIVLGAHHAKTEELRAFLRICRERIALDKGS